MSSNLHGIAQLLSRLTIKPFFEQYFKADEYARQIVKAGEDLSDFVQIFEVGLAYVNRSSRAAADTDRCCCVETTNESRQRERCSPLDKEARGHHGQRRRYHTHYGDTK